MILAHLSGLPPLFLTVCVCLRDCNVCELDSLMKMRNNSMKLGIRDENITEKLRRVAKLGMECSTWPLFSASEKGCWT